MDSAVKKHAGLAVVVHSKTAGTPSHFALAFLSEYGTLGKGDYIWHLQPNSPLTTRQRLPVWKESSLVPPGVLDVILFKKRNGGDPVICSLATLRSLVNKYTNKGARPLPSTVRGMQTATWETFKETQRRAALKAVTTESLHPDDSALVEWIESQSTTKTLLTPLDTRIPAKRALGEYATVAVTFTYTRDADLFAADAVLLPLVLRAKARELGVDRVTVSSWRHEGCMDFDVVGSPPQEDSESPKKRRTSSPSPSQPGPSSHRLLPAPHPPASRPAPQSDDHIFDTMHTLLDQLRARRRTSETLLAKDVQLKDALAQLEIHKTAAAQFKAKNEELCTQLQAAVNVFRPPSLKVTVLAHFAGKPPTIDADEVDVFLAIPAHTRALALSVIDTCLGSVEAMELGRRVMERILGVHPPFPKERIEEALTVTYSGEALEEISMAMVLRDTGALTRLLETVGETLGETCKSILTGIMMKVCGR